MKLLLIVAVMLFAQSALAHSGHHPDHLLLAAWHFLIDPQHFGWPLAAFVFSLAVVLLVRSLVILSLRGDDHGAR